MAKKTPEQQLIQICGEGIAAHEKHSRPSDRGGVIHRTSHKLGRHCLHASRGKDTAREPIKELISDLQSLSETKNQALKRQAKRLEISSRLIAKGHLHRTPEKLRHQYQAVICQQLGNLVIQMSDPTKREKRSEHIGELSELTTMGLINHPRDPDFMAIAALPHHDFPISNKKRGRNYDALFVHRDHGYQALQVKRACQGFCASPEKSHSNNERKYYHPQVAMVSGHCDFGIRRTNPDLQQYDLTIPELLVAAEHDPQSITGKERGILDLCASSLVTTIIEQGKSGRAGIAA